jgi:hypothetical protein
MSWRMIRLWLAILVLIALSVAGFWGVDQEWRFAGSWSEKFSTFMQTAYAVLGLVAVLLLLMRPRWARAMLYLWALTLVLTGATAPIIWGGTGAASAAFAACIMAVVAGLVIWLAPLPLASGPLLRWRWLMAGVFVIATVVVLAATLQFAPTAIRWKRMEGFCSGLAKDTSQKELTDLAKQEGYLVSTGSDAKGPFLKITGDDSVTSQYYCQARFKSDGSIDVISFTAGGTVK